MEQKDIWGKLMGSIKTLTLVNKGNKMDQTSKR
jgi:hypothetical protein